MAVDLEILSCFVDFGSFCDLSSVDNSWARSFHRQRVLKLPTKGCSIGYKNDNCLVDINNGEVKRIKKRIQNSANFTGRTFWQGTIGVSTRRSRNLCISQKTKCESAATPSAAATSNPRNNSLSN
jgi:hypothetical protein